MKDYELAWKVLRKDKSEKITKRKKQMVKLCQKWRNMKPLSANDVVHELKMRFLSNFDVNNDDIEYENDLVDEHNILNATNANSDGDLIAAL